MLGYTTPLWVAIAAPLLGKDTLTAPKLAGALLGLIGLAVILNPASIDWTNTNVLLGAGMVVLAAMSWAANIIYMSAHRWIASPLQLLLWQVLVATIVLTGSAVIMEGPPHAEWSWKLVLLFLYSGLIGTALAYWAMSMVNKSLRPRRRRSAPPGRRSLASPARRSCWATHRQALPLRPD